MGFVIAAILVISGICFFLIFFRKGSAKPAAAGSGNGAASGTRIDLSAFDEICAQDGEVDFWPLPGNDYQSIKELFDAGKRITPVLLKRNQPIRIAYIDNKEVKSIREIIPFRIVGSIDQTEGETQKDYDFYIEAFCLLRNQERSFHTNGILAAWNHGKEINLGDYLADLYRKTRKRYPH